MEYTNLLDALNTASAFDLFRLQIAIDRELSKPERIDTVKQALRVGMKITRFDAERNCLIPVEIVELKRSNVRVIDLVGEQTHWRIPYYALNINNADTKIYQNQQNLTANNLSVGDVVGFNHNGKEITGTIARLNQKTVSLVTMAGAKWRVAYTHLYRVHDGSAGEKTVHLADQ